jgi:hypothetical protein
MPSRRKTVSKQASITNSETDSGAHTFIPDLDTVGLANSNAELDPSPEEINELSRLLDGWARRTDIGSTKLWSSVASSIQVFVCVNIEHEADDMVCSRGS